MEYLKKSVLKPLLFLLCIKITSTSALTCYHNQLNFILSSDNTNIFYSHSNIQTLSKTMKSEDLKKIANG